VRVLIWNREGLFPVLRVIAELRRETIA
jgi:hypothetical protein